MVESSAGELFLESGHLLIGDVPLGSGAGLAGECELVDAADGGEGAVLGGDAGACQDGLLLGPLSGLAESLPD